MRCEPKKGEMRTVAIFHQYRDIVGDSRTDLLRFRKLSSCPNDDVRSPDEAYLCVNEGSERFG